MVSVKLCRRLAGHPVFCDRGELVQRADKTKTVVKAVGRISSAHGDRREGAGRHGPI
jgi:hypothetical protein